MVSFQRPRYREIMGYAVDEVFGSAELLELLEEKGTAYDFMAMKADKSGDSVSIAIQDIGIDILKAVGMDLILDVVEEQLRGLTENSYEDIALTREEILFCGKNTPLTVDGRHALRKRDS